MYDQIRSNSEASTLIIILSDNQVEDSGQVQVYRAGSFSVFHGILLEISCRPDFHPTFSMSSRNWHEPEPSFSTTQGAPPPDETSNLRDVARVGASSVGVGATFRWIEAACRSSSNCAK